MKFIKLTLVLFLISAFAHAQNWEVGKTYTDNEKWTEFIVGDLPLIISVPHGGTINLPDAPTRSCKGAVTVTDSRTIELVKEIEKAFLEKYKARPFIIISNLSRKHVDHNRDIDEGTCGDKSMEKPWHQFHDYIDTAVVLATKKFGKAIYIDLHGHGHTKQRLEVGYLLKADELRNLDAKDNQQIAKSSVANLLANDKKLDLEQLLVGPDAFGTLIAKEGFDAVPSKQDVAPLEEDKYFNGGYNTVRYTSSKYPNIFGWQIESNYKGVRDAAGRPVFAKAFVEVMAKYFKTYLKTSL
ncbi:hypothetical protein [Pedobacter xixiisoli]|uniref:N-formylglutamate amidohydrolase n=1 Tax=Pedobacter xixiisoli TaxID=1476464 RepID=A0A286A952_9SPHI|nr:hypothetical protein [Pedobacter xixiisoli]SOD18401.1 hypothetical protein SAMN06297358_2982 [Pedobacter xixiisoli]